MAIQKVKILALFCVSVREKNSTCGYVDVLVIAENISEARRLGIDACEDQGLIERENIKNTLIYEKESEVYHHV